MLFRSEFEITEEDFRFYEKMGVPVPTLCPEERARRRMAFLNHRNLYKRTCDGTGKKIISNYSPDKKVVVYDIPFWFSDAWDQFATGREFDFSRPFFEQFDELMQVSPRPNLFRSPQYDENSDFTNHSYKNKNCYLIFDSDKNRDAYYSYSINSCESVCDCYRMRGGELCYECVDCVKCYHSAFLQNCQNCIDSSFLKNCIGCKNCFGCVNLRNKQYYFLNEKCTKEEYEKKIVELELHNFFKLKDLRNHFQKFILQFPHKFMEGIQNENVQGNYLTRCKNAESCFDSSRLWDCKYVTQAFDEAKDCMDCVEIGDNAELLYETGCGGYNGHFLRFCSQSMDQVANLDYCYFCWQSKECFGCVGLRHAQYCILNKQHTKEEYFALREKIIEHMKKTGEWGEFFPIEISPFAYNETLAHEYFPMTK